VADDQYGSIYSSEQQDQAVCYHEYATGADGTVYCPKCGSVLRGSTYDNYRTHHDALPPDESFHHWGWIVLAGVVVIAIVVTLAWVNFSKRPTPIASPNGPETIELANEPLQSSAGTAGPGAVYTRADGVTFIPLASYTIWAKVVGLRSYAGYDKGASGFPIDLALVWGDVAKSDYNKYVSFNFSDTSSTNEWLESRLKTETQPWTMGYYQSHVSNNHICPANQNLYNAIMSVKKGDQVILKGYLVEAKTSAGKRIMASSQIRTDTGGGACETFYVQSVQIGDKVYE